MSKKPFRILGLHQVAIGSNEISRILKLWGDLLGLEKLYPFRLEEENVQGYKLRCGNKGFLPVEFELMEPIDPNKSPRVNKPALNHIALWVDPLHEMVKHLKEKGVRFTPGGIRKGSSGFEGAFIHPKENEEFPLAGEGVLIELVQAPPGIIQSYDAG